MSGIKRQPGWTCQLNSSHLRVFQAHQLRGTDAGHLSLALLLVCALFCNHYLGRNFLLQPNIEIFKDFIETSFIT